MASHVMLLLSFHLVGNYNLSWHETKCVHVMDGYDYVAVLVPELLEEKLLEVCSFSSISRDLCACARTCLKGVFWCINLLIIWHVIF